MIYDYNQTHKTILDSLPQGTKHIGYTYDSLVYSHENNVYKCIVREFLNVSEEVPLLLKLLKNPVEGINSPLSYNVIDEEHLLHKLYIFKFNKYDYDFDRINLISNDKLSFGEQLIKAVQNLHSMGYYHGDLKPKNICIWKNNVQIIDFGTTNEIEKEYTQTFRKNSFGWCTPKQYIKLLRRQFQQVPAIYDTIGMKLLKSLDCYDPNEESIDRTIEKIKEDCQMNDRFVVSMILIYLYTENNENFWCYNEHDEILNSIVQVGLNIIIFINNIEKYVTSHLNRMITPRYNDYIIENLKKI